MERRVSMSLEPGEGGSANVTTPRYIARTKSIIGARSAGGPSVPNSRLKSKSVEDKIGRLETSVSGKMCKPQLEASSSNQEHQLQTAFSVTNLLAITNGFSKEKEEIVRTMGFGSLLKLWPQKKFPRKLAFWVLRNMDRKTGEMQVDSATRIRFNDYDIELVLGIPRKNKTVRCNGEVSAMDVRRIKRILMLNQGTEVSLDSVEAILKRDYGSKMSIRERDAFKVAFLLCADAHFLGPRGAKARINQEIYKNIVNPSIIDEYNWCGYVLRSLIQSSRKVQHSVSCGNKTVTLDGCLLFAVVFYLDNLDFGNLMASKKMLPRIQDYQSSLLTNLVKEDRKHIAQAGPAEYGRHQLLRGDEVIYSRNSFFRKNLQQTTGKVDQLQDQRSEKQMSRAGKLEEMVMMLDKWAIKVNDITHQTRRAIVGLATENYTEDVGGKGCRGELATPGEMAFPQENQIIIPQVDNEVSNSEASANMQWETESAGTGSAGTNDDPGSSSLAIGTSMLSTSISDMQPSSYIQTQSAMENSSDNWEDNTIYHGDFPFDNDMSPPLRVENSQLEYEVLKKLKEMGLTTEENLEENECYEEASESNEDEIDCPTPLLIVTPAVEQGIICYQDDNYTNHNHAITVNDMKVVIQYINTDSIYGVSPFAIGMTHPDAALETQLSIQLCISCLNDEELKSIWYLHLSPKTIQISGTVLQMTFQGEADFVPDVMDAMVRLYQEMDTKMYSRWNEIRWRHFLPTDFAVWALNSVRRKPTVLDMDELLGGHKGYSVQACRLVMAPLLVHWHWCLYVWDFKKKKIIVLDPLGAKIGKTKLQDKHNVYLNLMASGLNECWSTLSNDNNTGNNIEDWEREYIISNDADSHSMNTGMYTMFYARYFDGEVLTRVLTKEAIQLQRFNLMYQLLKMDGNVAEPPTPIRNAISN